MKVTNGDSLKNRYNKGKTNIDPNNTGMNHMPGPQKKVKPISLNPSKSYGNTSINCEWK